MTAYLYTKIDQGANQVFGECLLEKPFKKKALIGKVRALV